MCSIEEPLCNAIKQVYRPPLPTSFSPLLVSMTKYPLPGQSIILCPLTAPGLRLWGQEWGDRKWEVTGPLKVIMAVVDYRVSSPSLPLAGEQCAAACMLISCGRGEGERTGSYGWGPARESDLTAAGAAQAPLTLPLNRWRQEGLAWAERYDWGRSHVLSAFCVCVYSWDWNSWRSLKLKPPWVWWQWTAS